MNLVTLFDELQYRFKDTEYCCKYGDGYIAICKNGYVTSIIIRACNTRFCIIDRDLKVTDMFNQQDIIDYFC